MNTNCLFALLSCAWIGATVEQPLPHSAETRAQVLLQQFAVGQAKPRSFIISSDSTSEYGTNGSAFCFDASLGRSVRYLRRNET
jgi:hypothetical protein